MSKRKGLSADDKRKKILAIYHEKQEPFNLKEIEHLGSREGVVQQTIKEINQSLVDDNLVYTDKIGAANFFWSFPKKAIQDQITLNGQLHGQLNQLQTSIQALQEEIDLVKVSRCKEDRRQLLDQYHRLVNEEKELDSQWEVVKFNDPDEIRRIGQVAEKSKEAANRWTDNLFMIKSFLVKKRGMSSKEVDKFLKIDSSFDYVE